MRVNLRESIALGIAVRERFGSWEAVKGLHVDAMKRAAIVATSTIWRAFRAASAASTSIRSARLRAPQAVPRSTSPVRGLTAGRMFSARGSEQLR